MRFPRIARQGLRALGASKLRTFLMMAGTIVGVAAVTVIMAIGGGTEKKVMKRVRTFGPRALMLIAGGGKDLPPPDMTVTTLTPEDAEAIRREIEGVEIVSPMAWSFRMGVKRGANQRQATVWGVEPSWHDAWGWYASAGEEISEADVATMSRVCVIGETIRRELFGSEDPIGQHLYLNRVRLTVKGVLQKRGGTPIGGDFDNRVIVPITTAMRRVMNVDHVGAIRLIAKDPARIPRIAADVRALMHDRHHINPPEEDDFRIITADVIAGMVRGTSRTLSVLLLVLAALGLLVGGVVMMNILLISVSERTREIGLRRALGATRRDILVQFLTESLSLTLLGMLVGVLLGGGVSLLLPRVTRMAVVLSWPPLALSVGLAVLVGLLFGVLPARRAAGLDPTEALR
jgi:putative ABC transport system permease protein